ncbi:MAG: sensor histidine kinase [Xylanivirga thermophila]|jgi:sensor histidine kinase YesM|uniref:sensor histidine kinase n=2 Tax=Xylanivirga thermophila TaxID=2496273 RepID=UPI00101BE4B6|nr:sensor histidine kinase [Xylanivirga thermophila]
MIILNKEARDEMKNRSFRSILLAFMISIIILMAFVNIYSIFATYSIEEQYRSMINNMFTINQVSRDINLSVFYFDKYFSTRVETNWKNYNASLNDAIDKLVALEGNLDKDSAIILRDLKNVIGSYQENADQAYKKLILSEKYDEFYPNFTEAKKVAGYVDEYVQRLNNSYLNYNGVIYQKLKQLTRMGRIIMVCLLVIITFMCIMFTIFFSKDITNPLNELVVASQKVSQGNFDIGGFKKSNINEINILFNDFNIMVKDIKGFIEEIKEKADIEKRLKDEEMKNLLFKNMLRDTQLKMLQSQINPHFLFNTLNTVTQMAIIENAPQTEKLINSISVLLRYSLNTVDERSTIGREVDIIKEYIYIQENRFKDRMNFVLDLDESLFNVEIPGMTLQPLVENAFIHGIEPKEDGGMISISIFKEDNFCNIRILDDGMGMSKEKVDRLLRDVDDTSYIGHTTGIGIKNVRNRLDIMYRGRSIFIIKSKPNIGTSINIKIPLEGLRDNDKTAYC